MKNIYLSYIWGGPGGSLCQTQGYQTFRAVRPHHRADKCIGRKKNNCQFFIYGPPMWRNVHFWLFYSYLGGGPGGPLCQIQGYQTFRAVRPHHRADKCIWRKKNNCHFFIYGPPMWINVHFWLFYSYLGGPGGPLRRTQDYQIFRAVRSHYRAD